MKLVLVSLLASAMVVGCMSSRVHHQVQCQGQAKSEVLNAMSALLLIEGLEVKQVNEGVGVLQAATAESHDIWSGHYITKNWQFVIRGDSVMAWAFERRATRNALGAEISHTDTYYDDRAHSDWGWYWHVRQGLEELCGSKAVILKSSK